MKRLAAYSITLVGAVALSALGASAQSTAADSLARKLTSGDVHVRAEAVARLNALPVIQLTPTARAGLVRLLDQEATGRAPVSDTTADGDETYDEYIIDLTSGVLRLQDPASLRGLVFLGIQTADDVQEFVASFGARTLPLLDEAWRTKENARPTIITTWGYAILVRGPNALGPEDRRRVLYAILSAADAYPIAVASAARVASLSTLTPVLADIAARNRSAVVRAVAEKAVTLLEPPRVYVAPLELLDQATEWLGGICARRDGQTDQQSGNQDDRRSDGDRGDGHDAGRDRRTTDDSPARRGVCAELSRRLEIARVALRAGRTTELKRAVASAATTAATARAGGVLTAAEGAVIQGNLEYLLSRL